MIKFNNNSFSSVYDETTSIGKIMKGTLKVFESWRDLIASGVPPLTLNNCKGVDLVDYKLYGNSVQDGTPTPDTPIEVESVGEKTSNLVDYSTVLNYRAVSGTTGTVSANNSRDCTDYINIEGANNISINLASSFAFYDENKTFISGETKSTSIFRNYSIPTNAKYICFDWLKETVGDSIVYAVLGNYTSNTMPIYEPYGYKIPIKVSGKNLFTPKKLLVSGSADNFVISDNDFSFEKETGVYTTVSVGYDVYLKAGTYRISGSATSSDGTDKIGIAVRLGSKFIVNNSSAGSNKGVNFSFTVTESTTYRIGFYSNYASASGTVTTFKNIQIELGTTATDYEPYIEPITTNIYLNEPLRKIGSYSDYIDFKNSKVIRLNRSKTVKATNLYHYNSSLTNIVVFRSSYTFSDSNGSSSYNTENKCNKFKYLNGGAISSITGNTGEFFALRAGYFYVSFNRDRFEDVISEAKALEYFNNLNATVVYPLATPIEETIELPNIPTLKGTTILSIDTTIQPSNLEVVYKGK